MKKGKVFLFYLETSAANDEPNHANFSTFYIAVVHKALSIKQQLANTFTSEYKAVIEYETSIRCQNLYLKMLLTNLLIFNIYYKK